MPLNHSVYVEGGGGGESQSNQPNKLYFGILKLLKEGAEIITLEHSYFFSEDIFTVWTGPNLVFYTSVMPWFVSNITSLNRSVFYDSIL